MAKIKEICQQLGLRPTKRKGQNFLVNEKILDDIIKAAEIKKEDVILEIGPGFGGLTEKLVKRAKKVIAVELDKKLAHFLSEKFRQQKNIEIIQDNILKFKNLKLKIKNYAYKIVANLPYNITGPVLRKFLNEKPKPQLMVLMLQKEVAERILAKNNKNSIISLITSFYGKAEIISTISKNNFWPRPKVDSAIIRIIPFNKNLSGISTKLFFSLIKTGFSSPRKQLINNLRKIKGRQILESIFKKEGLDFKVRAEDLSLDQWLGLYYHIYED